MSNTYGYVVFSGMRRLISWRDVLGVVFRVRIRPDDYCIHFFNCSRASLYPELLNGAYYIKCSAELV